MFDTEEPKKRDQQQSDIDCVKGIQYSMLDTEALHFKDLTDELYREYLFPGGDVVRLDNPVGLHVSDNGHRVYTADGKSNYIPKGWICLRWEVREGRKPFAF